MAQVGAEEEALDGLGEDASREAGEIGSVEDESEEGEAAEDDSSDDRPSEDARKARIAEEPWPAHSNPAIGRTIRSDNSLPAQQRFTRPPEIGVAATVQTTPEVKIDCLGHTR